MSSPVQLRVCYGVLNPVPAKDKLTCQKNVNLHVVPPAVSVKGQLQKKNVSPSSPKVEIKSVNDALCVNQCLSAPNVRNVLHVVKDPPVGGRLQKFWQVWLSLGSNPRVVSILREGYQLPFKERPPLTRCPVVASGSSNPLRNKNLNEALQSLGQKQAIERVSVQSSLGFYNRLFLVPKPNKKWRPILDLSQLNLYLAPATFKMETPDSNHQTLPSAGRVGHFAGFQRRVLSHPNKPQVAEISPIPHKRSDFSIHSPSLWPVDGSVGVHQRGQADGTVSGYSNPPVPRRLVTESPLPGNVPTTYPDPFGPMSLSRLGSQHGKIRAGSPTILRLRQISFRPISRPSQTHTGQVDGPISKDQPSLGSGDLLGQAIHVPNRPSNGHRETGCLGTVTHETHPMASEEALACPRTSGEDHSHSLVSPCSSKVVVEPRQCPIRSTFTPITARPPTVYRRIKRRLGRTLRRLHGKRPLVKVRKRLTHKFAGTQSSPLGLKTVRAMVLQPDRSCLHGQHHCGLLHQQGRGYEVRLSLCPPLETSTLVQPKTDYPEGQTHHLNVIADKLSRHNQVIQTEWSLLPEVCALLCRRWHIPSVDLFATRFNHKLPRFVSPVPNRSAWKVDALSLRWEDLDAYAFPPTALLPQVVAKLLDHGCRRIILIAPGWPNMPWFWDLVNMSVHIPLLLPQVANLLTQPFNLCPHRDLLNLNLHAWLLEPLPSSKQVSLQKWQQELRLLKDALPEPSMSQSGPFLSDGARRIRWTSGLPL